MRRGATRLASAAKEPPLSVPKRSRGAAVSPSHQGPSVPTEGPIFLNQNSETEEEHPSRRRKGRRASTNCPSFTPPERLCFYLSEPASQLRVCTSGYHYDHWHVPGSFYDGISEKLEFPRYSAEFDCVELNATFYRWFKDAVFEGWRARAAAIRPSFEYVIKAHQFYTHWKRLNVDDKFKESWEKFWRSCQLLGPHLGPVLFQFPENFKLHPSSPKRTKIRKRKNEGPGDEEEKEEEHQGTPPSNLARLEALGEILSPDCRAVFEFRHSSWFSEEVYEVLRRHNWCLALVETSGKGLGEDNGESWCGSLHRGPNPHPDNYPLDSCTWGVYVRFHGLGGKYVGAYGARRMATWAQRMREWAISGRKVYAAFNNTDDGIPPSAIADARALAAAMGELCETSVSPDHP